MPKAVVWALAGLGCVMPLGAHADYERVAPEGAFGRFLARVRQVAEQHDLKGFARLVDREFTVGEEQGRAASLAELRREPRRLAKMVQIIDAGACYRTGARLVQCECPDPGPALDHTHNTYSSFAIFERHGSRFVINVFSAAPN
jgi:hypothetical protein